MNEVLKLIGGNPVIPVYYNDNIDSCKDVLTKCYKGGIRVFEFVNRGVNARENFKQLLTFKSEHFPDLKLGIGTIKTGEQAKEFIALGAEFIVSPIIKKKIAEITAKHGLLWIPGCMTPTEIAKAEELGASLVKLFPGDSLGPNFLKAIKPLFPDLKFMPTGGVDTTEENIRTWKQAGIYAVGLGSKLFSPPADESGEDWLSERCKLLLKWSKA